MHNFVTIIFDNTTKAYAGLHELWRLDTSGDVTVHGTTVVHRNRWGQFEVDTKETFPAMATAVGVGIGALLGALAGPAGVAIGAAGGAAAGAAIGGMVGIGADLVRADSRDEAQAETAFMLHRGQAAIIADLGESSAKPLDERMYALGGIVRRRAWSTLQEDAWFSRQAASYLYPYEYTPSAFAL
jgi:uncharacterized membrane protein